MQHCIRTTGLSRDFSGFLAVDSIDLEVERGAFYGFLGPNGAGKSTTIKMLTGLLAPSNGTVEILGMDMIQNPLDIKARVGVVPEDLCLFENLTASEYLTFMGRMYSVPMNTIRERRAELLLLMGLEENPKSLIIDFSHGMKKKLSLAAALIHDPDLLFLDEPFEGIDPIATRVIRNVLETFVKRDSTVFLTSHILEIVEKLCSHVGIIKQGKLIMQSPMSELEDNASLESIFIEAVGDYESETAKLSWVEERV